ncbi:MAG: hypothetical protein HYT15_02920 [Candidatus Magasanikbacteria bacterium]|nr:hypothetical protein [Candidatus Magasanikbacteria bacterium]
MGDRPGKLPEEMTAQRDLSVKSDYLRNKEQFKTQLDKILQRELTVDNIDTRLYSYPDPTDWTGHNSA